MDKLRRIENNIDIAIVFCIFIIYSLLSSPIPEGIGFPEILISFLLITLIIIALNSPTETQNLPSLIGMFVVLWMIVVPSFFGLIINDNSLGNYVRDFIPLFFIFVPLALFPKIKAQPEKWLNILTNCFIFSGFFLSVRYAISGEGRAFEEVFIFDHAPINQCPTVIFSAIAGMSIGMIADKNFYYRAICFIAGFTSFFTLLMSVMRAQIAIIVIGILIVILMKFSTTTFLKLISWIAAGVMIGQLFFSDIFDIFSWVANMIESKNNLAGGIINGRDEEASAVIEHMLANFSGFFLGEGWGSELFLPTAGDIVRFTHQGIFFYFWKTGLFGVVLIFIYLSVIFDFENISYIKTKSRILENASQFIASIAAFVIFAGIEMGYKMLSFGFLLCIFTAIFAAKSNTKN